METQRTLVVRQFRPSRSRPSRFRFALLAVFVAALAFAPATASIFAQEISEEKAYEKPSPSKRIVAAKLDLKKQIAKLGKQYRTADTQQKRDKVIAERRAVETDIVTGVIEATRERDSQSRNSRDLSWFVENTKGSARESLYAELVTKYGDSSRLTNLVQALGNAKMVDQQVESWLTELTEHANEKVKGTATYELANFFEKVLAQQTERGDDASEYVQSHSADELNEKVDELFKTCVDEFASIAYDRGKIGWLVGNKLAAKNLSVGKIAPEIVGLDLDDVEFKLSDYRGKVVLIDFWGDW